MIFSLPNPIPATIRDPDDLQSFFRDLKLVPYYGTTETTSHSFLDLLKTLAELSPTFGSILGDINAYAFGINLEITTRNIPGLKSDTEPLSEDNQIEYVQYLRTLNISARTIVKLSKRINTHLSICGNAYLIVKRVTVGGTVQYFFKVPHFKNVVYVFSQDVGEEFLMVSKFIGDLEKLYKYPPKILRVTTEGEGLRWTQTGPGVEEAIVHIKNDNDIDDSDFYNRPFILGAMPWLYTDWKMGELSSKVSATDLVTKILLALEGPDPDAIGDEDGDELIELTGNGQIGQRRKMDYFERNMLVLKQLVTNMGRHPSTVGDARAASSIAAIEYPKGSAPPTSIPLELNRDTDYHTYQVEKAAVIICESLRWAPELISNRPALATLGGNLMYDIFTIKNEATIRPIQVKIEDLFNEILSQIHEIEGSPIQFTEYGISFPDIITEMIDKFKGSGGSSPGQAARETAPSSNISNQNVDDNGNNTDINNA